MKTSKNLLIVVAGLIVLALIATAYLRYVR
jgi:hypothetical protein